MGVQRKNYLRLADEATAPRSKLFYALMAEIGEPAGDLARKNVNQHGAAAVYEATMRAAAAIVVNLEFNLIAGAEIDVDRLVKDFKLMVENSISSQQVIGSATVAPKLDA